MRWWAALLGATALAAQPAPPHSIQADTARLAFHVSTPSAGLIDGQLRNAFEQLRKAAKGGRVVKVRAFTVNAPESTPAVLAALFTKARLPLPVISVIPVGALPLNGASVILESVFEAPQVLNANGLVFISGQLTQAALDPAKPRLPLAPLAERSLINLKSALAGFQPEPPSMLRLACFASALDDVADVRRAVAGSFPNAVLVLVQTERAPASHLIECEGVARLSTKTPEPVRLVNPTNAAFAQAAVVSAPSVIFTTTEVGTGSGQEAEAAAARQAFAHLKATLEAEGNSFGQVFYMSAYPKGAAALQKFRDIRWEFLDRSRAPASTNLSFQGPAGPAASLALDTILLPK